MWVGGNRHRVLYAQWEIRESDERFELPGEMPRPFAQPQLLRTAATARACYWS